MVRPIVMVSLLIPGMVQLVACCPNYDEVRYVIEEVVEVRISESEFLAALDANGDLDPGACDALCRSQIPTYDSYQIQSVEGCEVSAAGTSTSPAPPIDTGTSGDTGVDDSGLRDTGVDGVLVSCRVISDRAKQCVGGRDHATIAGEHRGVGSGPFAAWLGAQAHAEATSVKSFVRIAIELRAFGAPDVLVDGARAAARDEVLHARILRRLAADHGGASAPLAFLPAEERGLLDFAIENAVEGCVHETWAALVAAFQARHAATAEVRAAFALIAADEARHADLAWAIDAWLDTRLSEAERRQVRVAREAAANRLAQGEGEVAAEVRTAAGLPTEAQARVLLERLEGAVWSPVARAA